MILNYRIGREIMKKKKYISIALCSMALAAANAFPACAAIKNLEINADVDNISDWEPGVPFFPELEVEDEDSDMLSFRAYDEDLMNADPTRGCVLRFSIEAEDEWLHAFYYFNDEIPTEKDFENTMADYLTFEFNMITHGRGYLFEEGGGNE